METPRSTARKLIPVLVAAAVRRCHLAGVLCRLTVSLKLFHDSDPPAAQISVSDTGVGSGLGELQELDVSVLGLPDKWGGLLSITTTSFHDKEIHRYNLNLKEAHGSNTRLKRLSPAQKSIETFSGTDVCFSTSGDDNLDELTEWVLHFVQKMLVLQDQNVTIEVIVENVHSQGSRQNHFLQQNDCNSLQASESSLQCLVSGLENYVLKHGNIVEEEFQTCAAKREHLMVGNGQASSKGNSRDTGRTVDVGIVVAFKSSQPCCWRANSSVTQVLYFQDFSLSAIPSLSLSALLSTDWQSYGLKLKGNLLDGDGHAVLEWENLSIFAHIDIAVHVYNRTTASQARKQTSAERNLIKKAVKSALDDLKAKHPGMFLSTHAFKVREYVPDLSRSIAALIMSSNDMGFQGECVSLLGLHPGEADEETVESCIRERTVAIIETNDRKAKEDRADAVPCLFACESMHVLDDCLQGEEGYHEEDGVEEGDSNILEF